MFTFFGHSSNSMLQTRQAANSLNLEVWNYLMLNLYLITTPSKLTDDSISDLITFFVKSASPFIKNLNPSQKITARSLNLPARFVFIVYNINSKKEQRT